MAFGVIIIGDEILSGRRQDKHLPKIIELLGARGLALEWAEYVGDDPQRITDTLRRSFASGDVVFSTGGIGATPDDHTRQCAAAALGVALALHPDAEAAIRERIREMHAGSEPVDFGSPENQHRFQMGTFPVGSEIIPNGYNKIPGFSIRDHHFVPGFPVMAWPMIEWVLDTKYQHLFHRRVQRERSVIVYDAYEAQLTPLMEAIERQFKSVKVFSLPSVGDDMLPRHIDIGVKGDPALLDPAFESLMRSLRTMAARLGEQMRR
jgi:molybdopterin-biosynthesis enzyme MoeA-like protein